ncbi:Abi-alpha family protein [Comamonas aquatica]|jgi:hypothetical protein|uniref:Abi-alpha family protein n=1 Tax=Comamonas aquatica TaxID=225991 RepID=UPI003CFE993A
MSEEAKAVQEVAKTTGKAIDASREVGGFIARFISGSLEQGAGIFEDRLKYMRWERQVRLMQRAEQFMEKLGQSIPSRAVPLNIAIPLIQAASLEEDDTLQDKWAALLVNAATSTLTYEVRRSYVAILEQLTPCDAQILDVIYSVPFEESKHRGIATSDLPNRVWIPKEAEHELSAPSEDVVLALSNLVRVGCLRASMTYGGGEVYSRVNPTIAGKAFVEACRIPTA